jgi:hypothetical protein
MASPATAISSTVFLHSKKAFWELRPSCSNWFSSLAKKTDVTRSEPSLTARIITQTFCPLTMVGQAEHTSLDDDPGIQSALL